MHECVVLSMCERAVHACAFAFVCQDVSHTSETVMQLAMPTATLTREGALLNQTWGPYLPRSFGAMLIKHMKACCLQSYPEKVADYLESAGKYGMKTHLEEKLNKQVSIAGQGSAACEERQASGNLASVICVISPDCGRMCSCVHHVDIKRKRRMIADELAPHTLSLYICPPCYLTYCDTIRVPPDGVNRRRRGRAAEVATELQASYPGEKASYPCGKN